MGSGIREKFCSWNTKSWTLESRILRLESRIQVPQKRTGIQYLESGINGEESRIQDCLGFPNMGRKMTPYIIRAPKCDWNLLIYKPKKPYLFNTKSRLSCLNTGERCETISECSVPCEHGRCTHKPDVCECETNWGPPGNCSIYEGPCLNCSSEGGTCKDGPNTCKCKPGMNNDTQCPLLLNDILVLFPALIIILPVKKAHE